MDNKPTHCNNGFWNGFFVGGVFGALFLFMFSNPEGKKLFKKLLQRAEDVFEEYEDKVTSELKDSKKQQMQNKKDQESFTLRLKKRLFTKNGRKLSA